MTTIVTRAGKGSPLTNNEMDDNLTNLNNDKLETVSVTDIESGSKTGTGDKVVTDDSPTIISPEFSNSWTFSKVDGGVTSSAGFGLTDGYLQLEGTVSDGVIIDNLPIRLKSSTTTSLDVDDSGVTVRGTSLTVGTGISTGGNLTFSGTGNRITGDFSNATVANRVAFQTSTVNGITRLAAIPNGSATQSEFVFYNTTDPSNSSWGQYGVNASEQYQLSGKTGTGTYLPMTFYTGGSERVRIDTSGNVGIGTSSIIGKFNVGGGRSNFGANSETYSIGVGYTQTRVNSGQVCYIGATDSATPDLVFSNAAGTEMARIPNAGGFTVTTPAGLGYGTGAGGTVTQSTSKSTAVTLNKPCGQITMNNAALSGNTSVSFQVNNTLVAATDTAIVHIQGGTTSTLQYDVSVKSFAAGSFYIALRNITAGSLSEAVVVTFAIIKGATS